MVGTKAFVSVAWSTVVFHFLVTSSSCLAANLSLWKSYFCLYVMVYGFMWSNKDYFKCFESLQKLRAILGPSIVPIIYIVDRSNIKVLWF